MTCGNDESAPLPGRGSSRGGARQSGGGGEKAGSDTRQHWINRNLRTLYEEVASEPIPESFKSLLEELEEKEGKSADAPAEEPESNERRTPRTHS